MREQSKHIDFKLPKHILFISLAPKKTCWWHNGGKDSNFRVDTLLGLTRVYSRRHRMYAYRLTLGRLMISLGKWKV